MGHCGLLVTVELGIDLLLAFSSYPRQKVREKERRKGRWRTWGTGLTSRSCPDTVIAGGYFMQRHPSRGIIYPSCEQGDIGELQKQKVENRTSWGAKCAFSRCLE